MLLLSPSRFFEIPLERETGPGKEWQKVGSQPNKLSADVACIVYALKGVVGLRTKLNEYIYGPLMEIFMDSEAYVELNRRQKFHSIKAILLDNWVSQ
jgi:hypothetical protein